MSPTLAAGYAAPLEQEGLPALPAEDACAAVGAAFDTAAAARPHRGLAATLWAAHGRTFAAAALFKLTFDALQFTGPVLLNGLITFLAQSQAGCAAGGSGAACPPLGLGLAYAGLLLASSLGQTALLHQYFFRAFRFGQHLRTATIRAVYRKALTVALHGRGGEGGVGRLTNLMSTDAKRLQDATTYGMMLLSGPWQVGLCLALLWRVVGAPTLAGVGVMLAAMPANAAVARASKALQARLMGVKDERLGLAAEALGGIRLLKFFAWEGVFEARLGAVRARELRALRAYMGLQAVSAVLWSALPLLVTLATYAAFTLQHGAPPGAADTFTSLALFGLLRFPLAMMPSAVSNLLEASVSLRRVGTFLAAPDVDPAAVARGPPAPLGAPAVVVEGGTFAWGPPQRGGGADGAGVGGVGGDNGDGDGDEAGGAPAAPAAAAGAGAAPTPVTLSPPPPPPPALTGVSLSLPAGSLTAVVGPVGSGKSSLLAALCGELAVVAGRVAVGGSVALAAQQPFITNASLRDNVLFGAPLDRPRYAAVLRACQLVHDVAQLPAGDATEIGERGISLSGGQKARVALARAVYARPDMLLLDDVLSAVDAHVGAAIFDAVLRRRGEPGAPPLLEPHAAVVLVTHALQYLPQVDAVVVMDGGRVVGAGPLEELLVASAGGRGGGGVSPPGVLGRLLGAYEEDAAAVVRGAQAQMAPPVATAEAGAAGAAAAAGPTAPGGGGAPRPPAHEGIVDDGAAEEVRPASPAASAGADAEADADGARSPLLAGEGAPPSSATATTRGGGGRGGVFAAIAALARGRQTTAEGRARGSVGAAVYAAYVSAAGGWGVAVGLVALAAGFTAASMGASAYLSAWVTAAEAGAGEGGARAANLAALNAYAGIVGASLAVLVALRLGLAAAGVRAARALHARLLHAVLRLPLSFFDTTPLGRVLNRLSQDTYTLDEQLPSTAGSLLTTAASVVGTVALIVAVTPWFAAALLPLGGAYVWLRRYYVATARELQRLESVSRSPIYAHFGETLGGLATLRAFGAAQPARFAAASAAQLDANVRAYFAGTSANRWLAVRLEALGAGVTAGAALCAVLARGAGGSFPALAGLAVSTALGVTQSLNWLIRTSADMETQVVAVERVAEYAGLPGEEERLAAAAAAAGAGVGAGAGGGPAATAEPPPGWPSRGAVTISNLRARYRPTTPWVLKGVSLALAPGERLGVVGRTGSGKSSLAACLWRLLDVQEGTVAIDGVDTASVPLHALRSRLAIVPQTPELFAGPLRASLDVAGDRPDGELWAALTDVGLAPAVRALPGGLDAPLADGGAPLSVGQRQLVAVARALLRRPRVLVLDEASSSVDAAADAALQGALERGLGRGATIITIAHRVHTVLGCDRVAVLGDGRLVELGPPAELLRQPGSAFAALVREAR